MKLTAAYGVRSLPARSPHDNAMMVYPRSR